MTLESTSPTAAPKPVDVYLGYEIYEETTDLFIARPQGWAEGDRDQIEAEDLPTLRKRIWKWWHNLLD